MDTQVPVNTGLWHRAGSRLLRLADELGHQLGLPDRAQDALCARLDARLEDGQDARQAG